MENKKIAVIIDTDPGVDDIAALACSLYDDKMDIKLITTVSGNKDINIVTRNCMFALELMKKTDIPVVRGSGRALLRISPDASYIHQNDGMGGFTPPKEVKTQPISKNVVSEMFKVVKANAKNIVIIALGPMTNIAKLIKKHPEVTKMINHIYTEGCSSLSTSSERWQNHKSFNVRTDPEAVEIVINSGIPITYVPSEMGREKANFSEKEVEKISKINYVGKFIGQMFSNYWEPGYKDKRIATNDSCAVLSFRFPDLFETIRVDMHVNTSDNPGHTIITPNPNGKIEYCVKVDKKEMHNRYFTAIKKLDRFSME
ncbi:MAG: nucleoside hydrolase [bacterium]|nr:nucleoside hydrolase [bacterium]